MSSFGLQGVQVDTLLQNNQLQVGQILTGEIVFKGSNRDKTINGIFLELMTNAEVESNDHEYNQALCIAKWHISAAFQLQANQVHRFPFQVQLPFETPITELPCHNNKSRIWLHTHLDVDWGRDATDQDYLHIHPTPTMQLFLHAMQQCGFHLVSADVEKGQLNGQGFRSSIGCYQELEFRPTTFFNSIHEVEVSFIAQAHQTHVLLEIDRKFRGDSYRCLTLPHHALELNTLVQQIKYCLGL